MRYELASLNVLDNLSNSYRLGKQYLCFLYEGFPEPASLKLGANKFPSLLVILCRAEIWEAIGKSKLKSK